MKPSSLATFIAISAVMLSGCSTTENFIHTPTASSEFTKDISELKQNYSDIEKYDRIFASPNSAPTESELENLWGKPEVSKGWLSHILGLGLLAGLASAGYFPYPILALGFITTPTPVEKYVWEKGNYEITAVGRSDLFVRYEKRIHGWDWKSKANSKVIALNAKQDMKDVKN